MENGWRLKHLHRLIVNSATYQQSSVVTRELLALDPGNKLLARGSRFRVDAEIVRDIALASSGLLIRRVGGPSVYPPAPEFLFQRPASYGPKTWNWDAGPDQFRRALYTFRFRSVPYPVLQNFDAPNGDFSCVQRARSNTPLQALTTLNEDLFVECALALATDALAHGGNTDEDKIVFAMRRCLSRAPTDEESVVLQEFLDRQKERFRDQSTDSLPFVGDDTKFKSELPADVTAPEMVAWTALSRVLLNLDETITKE